MTPTCRKCGAEMQPGKTLVQTLTGIGDFRDRDEPVTLSPGGPGKLVDCWKCVSCGWSVTK